MASSSALIKLTMSMAITATTSKSSSSSSSSSSWVRRITTTTTSRGTARTTPSAAMMTMGRRNMNSKDAKNGEEISGWRLIKCAYFGGAQEMEKGMGRRNNSKGQKSFFSRLVADNNMGSENKDDRAAHRSPSTTATTTTTTTFASHNNHNHHLQQQPLHQSSSQPPKLLTLPTILTLGRVAAVPILVTTFYMNSWWATTATTSIFIVAAITDWLDGYLARKLRLGSAFGAFLDPVADKLMVAATLVLLCTRPLEFAPFGGIPWLLPVPAIAIIGREITMSAVREWAASQNGKVLEAVAVNNLGKWKTASQMIALTILLASRDSSLIGSNILVPSGVALLYVSAWLAVWSLVVYMKKIWRVLLKL